MRFTRLAAQLSGGGVTPQLPSTRVVFAILIASSVFTTTVADDDSASSSSLQQHHDDLSSCPPDDQCDTKKWCSAIAAAGVVADDKKSVVDDEYDHGVKCLDEQVVDRCGCCRECVRGSPGLPCGGIRRRGVCAAPLECLADVAVGRIAEPHEEGTCHERNCSAIVCPAVASKPCPEDSYALPSQVSPKSCCPISGGCACLPNDCLGKDCQPDEVRRLVKTGNSKPGSCCDSYECVPASGDRVCHVGKETYKNGETWHTKCSTCSCRNGVAMCNDNVCKGVDTHCSWLHKPEGECCPVCLGCLTSSGLRFNNGERWKEDDCTWCECISGKAKCEAQMCQTKCANPVKKPGVCCPVCEKSPSSSPPYPTHGAANHTSLSRSCPRDDRSVWRDQCRHCACLNGHEVCSLVACPRTYCEHPIMEPGACCPVCQNDAASPFHWPPAGTGVCQGLDGHIHREGDSWWLDDCVRCECVDGMALCDTMQCPPAPCANPTRKQGQCCATCTEEEQLGSNQSNQLPCAGGYKDGQSWRPEPCLSCLCRAGKERCFRETCPPLTCLEPLFLKNHCCPICPTATSSKASPVCRTDGKVYADGASWSPDNCKRCHCTLGQVQCSEMGCPPNMCRSANHTSGSCCIPCSTEGAIRAPNQWQCTRGGLVLADGEQRVIDNCNRCECSRGHLHCQETVCHQDLCRTHNHSSGNCCVQCAELHHYIKSSSSDVVGYVIAIVILVTIILALMCVACLWRRKNTRPFNKPKPTHYQKTANGYV